MSVVEFRDIHRAYRRGEDVLRGVTFGVGSGEVVGLLGKNGAGKTTLMRIAMGMIEAQRGAVRLFGLDPREQPLQVKRRLGFVAEDQILPSFLKVSEVLELHRHLFPSWDEATAERLSRRFELAPGAKIGTLSKGQARRVALVCAAAHRPELLLLDEPAGGLDPAARREFLETAIELVAEVETAILFSSHHMPDVERLAGRVVMLHDGRVLIDSDLDGLRENHCLALIPHAAETSPAQVLGLDRCLGVRHRSDALHAVFGLDPLASQALLQRELGVGGVLCSRIALEEMFIELVGGQP